MLNGTNQRPGDCMGGLERGCMRSLPGRCRCWSKPPPLELYKHTVLTKSPIFCAPWQHSTAHRAPHPSATSRDHSGPPGDVLYAFPTPHLYPASSKAPAASNRAVDGFHKAEPAELWRSAPSRAANPAPAARFDASYRPSDLSQSPAKARHCWRNASKSIANTYVDLCICAQWIS